MPEGAVYVGSPTTWGNPFRVNQKMQITPADTVAMYESFVADHPEVAEAARKHLAGKDLVCWCPLDQPCHADLLLQLANPGTELT